jgi:hypothetical protein
MHNVLSCRPISRASGRLPICHESRKVGGIEIHDCRAKGSFAKDVLLQEEKNGPLDSDGPGLNASRLPHDPLGILCDPVDGLRIRSRHWRYPRIVKPPPIGQKVGCLTEVTHVSIIVIIPEMVTTATGPQIFMDRHFVVDLNV